MSLQSPQVQKVGLSYNVQTYKKCKYNEFWRKKNIYYIFKLSKTIIKKKKELYFHKLKSIYIKLRLY